MNTLIALTGICFAVVLGLHLYARYGVYLRTKQSLVNRLSTPFSLSSCNPAENRDYDPASFQAYENALLGAGFEKLGKGGLMEVGQRPVPNFFMFFCHPGANCVAVVRQVFPTRRPHSGVQISISTRTEDGRTILTRSAGTYSDLALPEEELEIASNRSPEEVIQHHFQRLSTMKGAKVLPAPTTLAGCLGLANERRVRQVQAIQQKPTFGMALSFFKWRQQRLR